MKILKYILLILFFLPLLYFRDFTPNNELRYLSIANEACQHHRYFTFTNHSAVYADKPPLYFWLILAAKQVTGHHQMWLLSLFSLLPALIILYLMNRWVGPFVNSSYKQAGALMLLTSGLFAGSAVVLRMDMLMCLFIVLALYTFYRIYRGENRLRYRLLLPVYIFLALFSKGPVGLIVPLVSIYVFLLLKKEGKKSGRYFGWLQWVILLLLCGLWFMGVYLEGGKTYLYNLLFHQTVDRAVNAFHHQRPFYYYLESYWYALAPWSLFYITVLFIGIRRKGLRTDLEKLFLTVILTTFVLLSVFSSKLAIYLLPTFPFFTYLSLLFLPGIPSKNLLFTVFIPAVLLLFAFPGILISSRYISFQIPFSLKVSAFLLSLSAGLTLFFTYRKNILKAVNSLGGGILIALFFGSFALPVINPYIGFKQISDKALQIARQNGIDRFLFYKFRSGENMDVYLHQEIRKASLSEIDRLKDFQDFILFIRNKDLLKNTELRKLIAGKEIHLSGNYDIVIFKQPPELRLPNNPPTPGISQLTP